MVRFLAQPQHKLRLSQDLWEVALRGEQIQERSEALVKLL